MVNETIVMSNCSKGKISIEDVWLVTSKLTRPGFSRILGIGPERLLAEHMIDDMNYNKKEMQWEFKYEIPHTFESMTLSGFMGVLVDVSTWAIVAHDKGRRPGVSTTLYAEYGWAGLTKRDFDFVPGDTVQINCRVVKGGEKMAFVEAEAIDIEKEGGVICSCRHSKYLPMGLWNEVFLGSMMPVVSCFLELFPDRAPQVIPTSDELFRFTKISSDHSEGLFVIKGDHYNTGGSCRK